MRVPIVAIWTWPLRLPFTRIWVHPTFLVVLSRSAAEKEARLQELQRSIRSVVVVCVRV
jgi:hypothetical protein